MKPKVIKVEDATERTRKPPATLIMESLGDEYRSMKQMSERYGIHLETMRRICKATNKDGTPKVDAPRNGVQHGGLFLYVFDDEDVKVMDTYMSSKGYPVKE